VHSIKARYTFIGDGEAKVHELVASASQNLGKIQALGGTLLNVTLQTLAGQISPFIDPPCGTCVALKDMLKGVVPDKTIEKAMKPEHKFAWAVDNGKKAGPKNKARAAAKQAAESEIAMTIVPLDRLHEIQDAGKTARRSVTILSEDGMFAGAFADCEASSSSQPHAAYPQPMLAGSELQITNTSGVFPVHGGK
jgi:hypothetical protein